MIEFILPPKPKMIVTPLSAYNLYLTLKAHYAGKYDVVKYQWRPIVASEASFRKYGGRYYFEKMAKKHNLGDLAAIMIVNFATNPDAWGGEIATADALSFYRTSLGRIEAMEKHFSDEVTEMINFAKMKGLKFKELIYSTNGQPWIFKFVQQRIISYETMIVLDALFNFVDTYDSLNDHVWANGYAKRIKAYRALVNINKEQAKACFQNTVNKYKRYNT